jgi:restriction system protein
MEDKLSPSRATGSKTLFEALKILKEEGGHLAGRDVIEKMGKRLQFSDWEKEIYEKTGNVRWRSIFHFYTIAPIKAGYMRKVKGIWYLTPEGEEALKLGPEGLMDSAESFYKKWALERKGIETNEKASIEDMEAIEPKAQQANLEELEEQAIESLKEFIIKKNAYEFQDLVAALLRAMGYFTPFISPKGKDGGIDIVAFQDPLGIKTPRIKVQVKHYPENPVSADTIRSLKGLINGDSEVGLFVTSGRFSNEAERFAREANIHVKLINGEEFISLWQEFYAKMPDEDKNMLPLQPIYFLGSNE